LRLEPHGLDGVLDIARLIVIGIAELGSPSRVPGQIIEHRRKLNQRLDGWIPGLRIRLRGTLIWRQRHVLVQPGVGGGDLIRVSRRRQDGSDQRIRIQSNRSDDLIELRRIQVYIRRRWRLRVYAHLRGGDQERGKDHGQQLAQVVTERVLAHEVNNSGSYKHANPRFLSISVNVAQHVQVTTKNA
jgi:hypothetical protein